MKHLFIVNPVAGKGKTVKRIPEIREYCESRSLSYEIKTTDHPGHATEIARAYSSSQALRIYSVGGDGTLNEVLNGMAGSGSSLAVIPCGSGNDFIRSVVGAKIPEDIIPLTIGGSEQLIDYAKVNDKYFINIMSLGFDAEVAYQTGHFKNLPLISGETAYVLGILTTIAICKYEHMTLKIDDDEFSGKYLLAAVGNGQYYGGGMHALPEAVIDDGLFDICFVEPKRRSQILRLFPQYMKGLHGSIEGVHFRRSKKVEITLDKPIPLNCDGEILKADKAVLEMFHKALPFVFPAKA